MGGDESPSSSLSSSPMSSSLSLSPSSSPSSSLFSMSFKPDHTSCRQGNSNRHISFPTFNTTNQITHLHHHHHLLLHHQYHPLHQQQQQQQQQQRHQQHQKEQQDKPQQHQLPYDCQQTPQQNSSTNPRRRSSAPTIPRKKEFSFPTIPMESRPTKLNQTDPHRISTTSVPCPVDVSSLPFELHCGGGSSGDGCGSNGGGCNGYNGGIGGGGSCGGDRVNDSFSSFCSSPSPSSSFCPSFSLCPSPSSSCAFSGSLLCTPHHQIFGLTKDLLFLHPPLSSHLLPTVPLSGYPSS
eukprot:TRINITY_DN12874_c0_g1_i3.p1 TRINITY_DN12874_c0_g1~~TRINITY_DN12874_c0_g1_i3.p1  ORF type:complete len:314 (+),score=98.96 TRINITY_DN12874_c0_g1_i3:62-943(+)